MSRRSISANEEIGIVVEADETSEVSNASEPGDNAGNDKIMQPISSSCLLRIWIRRSPHTKNLYNVIKCRMSRRSLSEHEEIGIVVEKEETLEVSNTWEQGDNAGTDFTAADQFHLFTKYIRKYQLIVMIIVRVQDDRLCIPECFS